MPLNPDTRRAVLIVVVVSLTILLAGSWALPLLDRDEPRFSRATVEMLERGDWVVPYFNGGHRFDKPPLTYWLMAVGYGAFGVNELGARLHSILSATLIAAVLFLFGRRLFSSRVGFAAAFAWATCFQVYLHGRLALADMPMILAVLVAHWALYELLFESGSRRYGVWFWALWLSLAFGFLAKGPIAVITPALTLAFTRLFLWRRPLAWSRLQAAAGLPVALALVGAWGIPALLRTGGEFWQVGIGEHVVRRGVVAFNDRPIVPFYYLITVFLSLFPWSPNLGQAVVEMRRNFRDDKTKFLFAWLLGPFLIFSLYSTQLPHYTLPAFPALLLLMLRGGVDPRRFSSASRRLYYGLHTLFAALFASVLVYATSITLPPELRGLQVSVMALAIALLALQATACLFARTQPQLTGGAAERIGPYLPIGGGIVVATIATLVFTTSIRPLALPIRLQQRFATMPADTTYIARGYAEPSLVFYAEATWDLSSGRSTSGLLETPGPLLFLYQAGEQDLGQLFRPDAVKSTASEESIDATAARTGVPRSLIDSDLQRERVYGFNFARSSWTEVLLFYRE